MKPVLIDTDILSMFLRKHRKVVAKFEKYLREYDSINISIITYYEIVSGLKSMLTSGLKSVGVENCILLTTDTHEVLSPLITDNPLGLRIDWMSIVKLTCKTCVEAMGKMRGGRVKVGLREFPIKVVGEHMMSGIVKGGILTRRLLAVLTPILTGLTLLITYMICLL